MAVADLLRPNPQGIPAGAPFSRFSQVRRSATSNHNSEQPPFTLESLAEIIGRSNPTNDLAYLTEGYYTPPTPPRATTQGQTPSRRHFQKSLSFPKVKRDSTPRPCVQGDRVLRRSKSVRFADTQGLPLIEAIHQLSAGDSSYTENKIVPYDESCEIQSVRVVSCREIQAKNKKNSPAKETKQEVPKITVESGPATSSAKFTRQTSSSPSSPRRIFRFSLPGSEPGFFERVSKDKVALESIREEPRLIQGIIRVANVAFHKEVHIRWSHDHWRSYHDTMAVFLANDGATDRFLFELPANGEDMEFCIRFKCDGTEYWDNNRGKNYRVEGNRGQ